jgi:hypothetical protein
MCTDVSEELASAFIRIYDLDVSEKPYAAFTISTDDLTYLNDVIRGMVQR